MRTPNPWTGALLSVALAAFAGLFPLPSMAQSRMEIAAAYQLQRSNGPAGVCGCFTLQGGRGDLSYTAAQNLAIVGEFSGSHASNLNGSGLNLSLVTFLGGPRYTPFASHRLTPFAQLLIGGVHGFDATFPHGSGVSATASSFAFSVGGGLTYVMSRRIAVRVFEIDYLRTYLPNNTTDAQNNLRLGAGVALRLGSPRKYIPRH